MRNPTSSSPASATEAAESGAGGAKSTPCCSKVGLKRGPWTPEEDELLSNYINKEGEGRWRTLPKRAGLLRCGKSCRLRWMNYLRPSVKRGHIAADEEDLILRLHRLLGNRWSLIAGRIPGRTDNEIKNYWNTHLSKKLISQGIDPRTHKPLSNVQITNCNSATTKQKDVNTLLSTSKAAAAAHPNPNQMHPTYNSDNSNSTGVLVGAVHGREDGQQTHHLFHMKENSTNAEFCFDLTRNSTSYDPNANALVSPCKSTINASHHHHDHHPNYNASFTGITNKNNDNVCGESPRSFEDQDQDPNYCNDDVFSSFLNSLINEEMFTPQGQQQLPRYDALQLGTQPNINPAFGAPAGWDAAPTSAAGFHHGISPDDQPL